MASLWNKKGAIFILLSALLASLISSFVHGLGAPIPASQLLFLKSAMAFIVCMPWVVRDWTTIKNSPNKGLHIQKAFFGAVGNVFWLSALQVLPLADASTLSLTSALLTTLGAALFFKERIRFATCAALTLGGLGVCIVMKPSIAIFSWNATLPLMSAVCYTASSLFVKKISIKDSTMVSVIYLLGGMAVLSAPFAFLNWVSLSVWDLTIIFAIACLYCGVQWSLIYAYAHASAGFLAPFKFARFPLACVIGFVWFGEVPSAYVIAGGVLIFAGCTLIQYTRHDASYLLQLRSRK
jgi:drug/metabolite transporter (DMT)-like permease